VGSRTDPDADQDHRILSVDVKPAWFDDSKYIIVSGDSAGQVQVLLVSDEGDASCLAIFEQKGPVLCVQATCISDRGSTTDMIIASGSTTGEITIWSISNIM